MKKNLCLLIALWSIFAVFLRPGYCLTIAQFEQVKTVDIPSLKSPLQVRFYQDNLFILDGQSNLLLRLDANNLMQVPEGILLAPLANKIKNALKKMKITSFALDQQQIYALDQNNKNILIFDHKGGFKKYLPLPSGMAPVQLELYEDGLLVADTNNHQVVKMSLSNGAIQNLIDLTASGSPYSILALNDQEVLVSDILNNSVLKANLASKKSQKISKFGAWEGRLFYPKGLAAHGGHLLVADSFLGIIGQYSLDSGAYLGLVGSGAKPKIFEHPVGIAWDEKHQYLAIADPIEQQVTVLKDLNNTVIHKDPYRVNLLKLKYYQRDYFRNQCYQCHDGSLINSLEILSQKNQHPVDKEVNNPDIKVDADVPLRKGRVYCGSCHVPHDRSGNKSFFRFNNPNEDKSWCVKCHAFQEKYQHHPLGVVIEDKAVIKNLKENGAKLDKLNRITCETCHNTHFARNAKLLNFSENASEICFVCHTNRHYRPGVNHPVEFKQSIASKNIPNKGCLNCHDIHFARKGTKDITTKRTNPVFCLDCHDDKSVMLGSPHDAVHWDNTYKDKLYLKDKKEINPCLTCHSTHNAISAEHLLSRSAKVGGPNLDIISEQCLTCHSGQNKKAIRYYQHETPLPFNKLNLEV
ncbi:MAG: cytochrome c3 family protein [Pseudomonadota bacterium]